LKTEKREEEQTNNEESSSVNFGIIANSDCYYLFSFFYISIFICAGSSSLLYVVDLIFVQKI